jgi:hypothetical protein
MATITTPMTSVDRTNHFRQVSAFYTNDGYDRIKRHWKYVNDKDTDVSLTAPITFVVSGAITGAKIGHEIGERFGKTVVQESSERKFGGFIGGGLGFLLGAGMGGMTYIKLIEQSVNYKKFITIGVDNAIKESITYNYSGDSILENFCCPVSLCVMDFPAFTPSGVLYDYAFLINCPRETNGHIKDPNKNLSFHEDKILIHFELGFVIKKRIKFLMAQDIQSLINNPILKASLEKEYIKIERACTPLYEEGRSVIEERRRGKIINNLEYQKEIREYENLFGTDETQELNWNLGWQATLSVRWKHFHPDAKVLNQNQ